MTTAYTSLLGLALPVPGELTGTWGSVVNNSITSLLDTAIAGVATASVTSGDWTLSDIDGASSDARAAIIRPTGSPGVGVSRNIIAPSQSKAYIIQNESNGPVVIKGSATTGVTIAAGKTTLVAWNGSDFVEIVPSLSTTATAANGLNSATTTVAVNGATAPTTGQVLTATSGSAATWQTPSTAGGTVTSVGGTGTVNGITLSGTVTSSGNLTLGGTLSGVSLSTQVTGTLPVANGGTGTTTPALVAGTNVTITGTWPNQTINASSSGGSVTSVAATVPSFLSVSGSPITSSGTLAITLSGTALPVLNGGTGVTTSTGSGNNVLSTSPTLVTPVLGTPSSGDLSSCTNAVAYGLKSASTTVSVSSATAPTTGQVLTATSSTAATWQSAGASTPAYGAIGSYVHAATSIAAATSLTNGSTVAGSTLVRWNGGGGADYILSLGSGGPNNFTYAVSGGVFTSVSMGLSGTWQLMDGVIRNNVSGITAYPILGFWMRIA